MLNRRDGVTDGKPFLVLYMAPQRVGLGSGEAIFLCQNDDKDVASRKVVTCLERYANPITQRFRARNEYVVLNG